MEITESNQKECWDNNIIVKSYSAAIKLSRDSIATELAAKTNKNFEAFEQSDKTCFQFAVGDYVRATYSDGIDYEAKIMSIDGEMCKICYIGYNNEDQIHASKLVPSWGKKYRRLQFKEAKQSNNSNNVKQSNKSNKKNRTSDFWLPPPPPLPMTPLSGEDYSEEYFAMLMSWYMSGYYTGVYQVLRSPKKFKNTNVQ